MTAPLVDVAPLGPLPADDADGPEPLVEPGRCTFVFEGSADLVAVEHRVVGLREPLPLQRVEGGDRWAATVTCPAGSRIEYRLLVTRDGATESVLDPKNPRIARGPMSELSVLEADGYATPDWAEHDESVPQGALSEVRLPSRALRRQVNVTIYAPARGGDALPLLIVHDGGDFLQYAGLGTVLDNLMHQRLVADSFVAFVHPRDRMREYTASAAHSRFLNEELVPELERTLPIRSDPDARVLLGASLGAVASLAAATRDPGMYGGLMLQSGSFRRSLGGFRAVPRLTAAARFIDRLHQNPSRITRRIVQSYGAFEPLAESNREMTPVLRRLADSVAVFEALDGHNWISWRDRMLDGLALLLPPSESDFVAERAS